MIYNMTEKEWDSVIAVHLKGTFNTCRHAAKYFRDHCKENPKLRNFGRIINTASDILDLEQLKPIIKRCNLLVTNDTGPRHYAVAFDVPVVVLMGPTNPDYTAANLDRTPVFREEMECSPCHKKICPTDHRCMKDITPEKVFIGVKKLLKDFDGAL